MTSSEYVRTHRIKIQECYLQNVETGRKRFEVRKDDRDYQVGDWLILESTEETRSLAVEVIYKSTYEQKDGYCILGIDWPRRTPEPEETPS